MEGNAVKTVRWKIKFKEKLWDTASDSTLFRSGMWVDSLTLGRHTLYMGGQGLLYTANTWEGELRQYKMHNLSEVDLVRGKIWYS